MIYAVTEFSLKRQVPSDQGMGTSSGAWLFVQDNQKCGLSRVYTCSRLVTPQGPAGWALPPFDEGLDESSIALGSGQMEQCHSSESL